MKLFTLPLLLTLLYAHTHAYKILGIFGLPYPSHNILAKGVVDSLLDAGHEVTWATAYPEKVKPKPNLRIIDLSATQEVIKDADFSKPLDSAYLDEKVRFISEVVINAKALRDVIVNEKFDAVINEWFFSDFDSGFAAVQQVPWIALVSTVMHPPLEVLLDEVRSITTVPMMLFSDDASMPMTFWQRVSNVAKYGLIWFDGIKNLPEYKSRYEQYFGPLAAARGVTLPPFSEAKRNISVLLVNSHPAISVAQVLPANVVEIAGYHISEKTDPLPKDFQEILDSSKQGVVYFSMGFILKSVMFPEHTRKALIQIFNELPYTVLWKLEEVPPGLSKNVHVRSWFPQASVLAHPNVKLFITHGGQLSCLEAIKSGVPLLAIPMFGDQPNNAYRAVKLGYAKMVRFSEHMAPELSVALKEMLADDRYFKKAKFLSNLFNKRLLPPSKLISHYVELAIESKGAYHLRSPSNLYPWYERWMLDFAALVLLLLYVVKIILTRFFSALFRKKPQGKLKMN